MENDTTSIIASEPSISVDGHQVKTSSAPEEPVIENTFLTVSNFVLCAAHGVSFRRELTPLSGLEVIGDGLSFLVKRSPRWEQVRGKDAPVRAFKISKARLSPGSWARDYSKKEQHRIRALITECRVLTHPPLAVHPNIVTLQEILWTPDPNDASLTTACLVLEYASFGTLADFQRYGTIHPSNYWTKKKLCLDVAEGLLALHRCDIIHGDVKSENVLVFDHPKDKYIAKLSDFGCAIINFPHCDKTEGSPAYLNGYTPNYRAPEAGQSLASNQLHLTDVYSFGLLVWRVLVDGDEPFSTFFDLPSDASARQTMILQIQHMDGALVGIAVDTIDRVVGLLEKLGEDEKSHLINLFLNTLMSNPHARSLEGAAAVLRRLLGIPEQCKEYINFPVQPMTDKYGFLPRSIEFLAFLGKPLQNCFFSALEDVASQCQRLLQKGLRDDVTFIASQALWVMLECRVSGIGCERNPSEVLKILSDISNLRGFLAPKASAIWLSLRDALGGEMTADTADAALKATIIACVNDAMPALRWVKENIPQMLENPHYIESRDSRLCKIHGMTDYALVIQSREGFLQYTQQLDREHEVDKPVFGSGNTICHAVALFGDSEMLKALTEQHHCNTNLENELGETPLFIACKHGRSQEVLYLIESGARISVANGVSLLEYLPLVEPEYVNFLAEALHRCGVKPKEEWCEGALSDLHSNDYAFFGGIKGDAMVKAIGTNRLDIAEVILTLSEKEYPCMSVEPKDYLARSIEVAAILHAWTILQYLLSKAFGDDYKLGKETVGRGWRVRGKSSLMRYVLSGDYNMNRITIHGACFHVAAKETLRVLDEFGFVEPFLYFGTTKKSTLVSALETGGEEMATLLLDFRAILDSLDIPDPQTGFTPLDACIRQGARTTFNRLIESGAQYKHDGTYISGDIKSFNKWSCLHSCANVTDTWFAERLLNAGVPVHIGDRNGCPPLHLALLRGSYSLAKLFMLRGESLNRVLDCGYTVMGMLLCPAFRELYHDFLGTMRFVLSLEEPYGKPNFIVHPARQQSLLHIAVDTDPTPLERIKGDGSFLVRDDSFDALTALILKFFPGPSQVNAKNSGGLTPLHVAITNRNLSAVRLLLGAGADAMIPLPSGSFRSTLAEARSLILVYGNQTLTQGQIPRAFRELTKRSRAIAALIYRAGVWGNQGRIYSIVEKLYEAVEPYLSQMSHLEHEEAKFLGLQKFALSIINNHLHLDLADLFEDEPSLKELLEYQENLNELLQPWFMAEVAIEFRQIGDPSNMRKDESEEATINVLQHVPWLREFTPIGIREIQQAALFEVILRGTADVNMISDWNDPYKNNYSSYSRSRDPADLPIDPRVVRYPYPLKDIYERLLKLGVLEKLDIRHVLRCLRFLDGGMNPERFSAVDPLPMDPEEFRTFHLQTLQGQHLHIGNLNTTLAIRVKCGCHNHKIHKLSSRELEPLKQIMEGTSKSSSISPKDATSHLNEALSSSIYEGVAVMPNEEILPNQVNLSALKDALQNTEDHDEVEHFGIFCAGAPCASKIWTSSFIKGKRTLCLPCKTANFCEACENQHRHPQLYVHGMQHFAESDLSREDYEEMRKLGRFVEQTVWKNGWLTASGELVFGGETLVPGSSYPVEHYGIVCDGAACRDKVAGHYITGARYQCKSCDDVDLCSICEPLHDRTHARVRIDESALTKDQWYDLARSQLSEKHKQIEQDMRDDLLNVMLKWTVLAP